jgi:hypothetical protein
LWWSSDSTQVSIEHLPAGVAPVRPETPSVIATFTQVMYTQLGPTGATGPAGSNGATGATGATPNIPRSFGVVFDGGGSVLTAGLQADVVIPYAMTITGWTILGDIGGTASVDIWSAPYATYPPTIANTIIGATGTKPNLAGSIKGQNTTLTNWTTGVTAGNIIRFNLDSVTTQTRITLTVQGNQ